MSESKNSNQERRTSIRSSINGQTRFKLENGDTYSKALIIDMSQTGVLIGIDKPLQEHTRFFLTMESESDYEGSIEIHAEVIRLQRELGDGCYTYGCMIHDVSGF